MLTFTRVTCLSCEHRVASRATLRGGQDGQVAVCIVCWGAWARDGRICAVCRGMLHEEEEFGALFRPRPSFGHVQCGGIRMTR
jgi:hypothetical protein